MRTMFVNPRKPKRRKARANPKRRRAHSAPAPRRRGRRRNPPGTGITPFVSSLNRNPQIPAHLVANPRRRSRMRRSNPLAPKRLIEDTFMNLGGAGLAVGANYFAINKIDNVWARNGSRAAAAIAAGMYLPGKLGSAAAGAMLYPTILELVDYFAPKGWGETSADLDSLSADLEDLLNVG